MIPSHHGCGLQSTFAGRQARHQARHADRNSPSPTGLSCDSGEIAARRHGHVRGARPLRDRALDNLQFIRSTMERAGSFTAVPGGGMVVLGVTALAASWYAGSVPVAPVYGASQSRWLWVWMFEALLGAGIGVAALLYKALRAG